MTHRRHGSRFRVKTDKVINARPLALDHSRSFTAERGEVLDEVVLDHWLHIEKLDTNVYWLRLGDAYVTVRLRRGQAPEVNIERGVYGGVHGTTKGGAS